MLSALASPLVAVATPLVAVVTAVSPGLPPGPAADVRALARTAASVGVAAAAGVAPTRAEARPRVPWRRPGAHWVWPLRPVPAVIRGFEPPPQPWAGGHRGVDLAGRAGQRVLAAGSGVVTYSGVVAGRGVVTVRHAGGRRTTYEPVDDRLATGSPVATGDPVGRLSGGPASHCFPRVCLHWGLVSGVSDYHDPLLLLALGHPVLLPLQLG